MAIEEKVDNNSQELRLPETDDMVLDRDKRVLIPNS